jgi:hypothetical protein
VAFDAAIFATCLLGAWGTRTAIGGVAAAAGWFVAVFVLASGTSGGSVLIAAASAGEWFLFGGAVSATAGLVTGFAIWSRPRRPGDHPT